MIISPLCGVAQTPDCGRFVISFTYKPFMWHRLDARLWHACYFIYFISPLCGVAQTPDCGMLVIYFISPLCGVAQTPDCGMLVILFTL